MARPDARPGDATQLLLLDPEDDTWPPPRVVNESEPDLADDYEELLGHLYRSFASGIASARWPIDAELHASDLLGAVEALVVSEGLTAPEGAGEPFDLLFGQVVQYAAQQGTPAAQAVLRTLAVFADDDFRALIGQAADERAAAGVAEPRWGRTIGRPAVERCWRFADLFGDQESIHVTFAYGARRHGLAVLIDHQLGGGMKDAWVTDDPDQMWFSTSRMAQEAPAAEFGKITWADARRTLAAAGEAEPCPVELDQIEDLAAHAHLVAARVALLGDEQDLRGAARRNR